MSIERHHAEWLYFTESSGPFLTVPVVKRVFPQGLDALDKELRARLRLAYDEWTELDREDEQATALHEAWIRLVLTEALGYPADLLREDLSELERWSTKVPEHGEKLQPSFALVDPDGNSDANARLLIWTWPRAQEDLQGTVAESRWAASPVERMAMLLRHRGVRLGLVTNGDHWVLVSAAEGETTGYAHWYSSLWFEESVTLRSFVALLGARRFFGVAGEDTLDAMLTESASYQHEVTEQLGAQVRKAVEVLVQSLDRADQDANRTLLKTISEQEIYEAAVTVMMRLVFILSAEERGLLLLGDPTYDQQYAVSTLRGQLREEADRVGEEVLERRQDAWLRLLAAFRAIHGGIQHESLRLPAYGGSLFDPDRFPFLEGRSPDTKWQETDSAEPLPVDNRTILLLLESLQLLRLKGSKGSTEAQRLSFRALDIEQIGHVYEGLLDHRAMRLTEAALGFQGAKGLEPEIALSELENEAERGRKYLVDSLTKHTGRSKSAIRNGLDREPDAEVEAALLVACGNDRELLKRILPYHALIRDDAWGYPVVYCEGSFAVTTGLDRRSTGTHYTPRSLTEEIVQHALDPLVYEGPAEGTDRGEWKLRSAGELLRIRICDPAMGSGAFLVQICRYLSERLVEAWDAEGTDGKEITVEGDAPTDKADELLVPIDADDRLALARRLVAERCIYGVDVNPMAVEMAKLSIWLITLSKGRPFEFLDHALKCGDSLLGVHELDQLRHLHPDTERGKELHLTLFDPREYLRRAIDEALELRQRLRAMPVIDTMDVERKTELSRRADRALSRIQLVGHAIVAAALAMHEGGAGAVDEVITAYSSRLQRMLSRDGLLLDASLEAEIAAALNRGKPPLHPDRRPFHWPLEFPEVFLVERPGFDAIVMNPPFRGGKRISGILGTDYRTYLIERVAAGVRGNADLSAYFLLRVSQVTSPVAVVGSLATNTIGQGDTREVALERLTADDWAIVRCDPSRRWPGGANVFIALIWLTKLRWQGNIQLSGNQVEGITPSLFPESGVGGSPYRLAGNKSLCFIGSLLNGAGFVLTDEEAGLLRRNPANREVILPYLTGQDLNARPDASPSRWAINFFDWPLERASQYPEVLQVVVERVKPHRDSLPDSKRRVGENWWRYEHEAKRLYDAIERKGLRRVLAVAEVSKTLMPTFAPSGIVYSHTLCVFPIEDPAWLAFLGSSFHYWWVMRWSSTLKTDIRYSPTDCFETLPLPEMTQGLRDLGVRLHEWRERMAGESEDGLTAIYNRLHDPADESDQVRELRSLHCRIDVETAAAYGWDDMRLSYDFHQTRWGLRFCPNQDVRQAILDRLLELNHEVYRVQGKRE